MTTGPNPKKDNGQGRYNFQDVNARGGPLANQHRGGENSQLEGALYNDTDTTHRYKQETIVHRQIAELARQGYNGVEIGGIVGRTPATVQKVLKQPCARQYMINAVKNDTLADMKAALEAFAPVGVGNLIAMASDTKLKEANPKLFSDINDSLVTRVLGKPVQPLNHSHSVVDPDSLTDEELAQRAMAPTPQPGAKLRQSSESLDVEQNGHSHNGHGIGNGVAPITFPTSDPAHAVNGNSQIASGPSHLPEAEFLGEGAVATSNGSIPGGTPCRVVVDVMPPPPTGMASMTSPNPKPASAGHSVALAQNGHEPSVLSCDYSKDPDDGLTTPIDGSLTTAPPEPDPSTKRRVPPSTA